jgi:hypothetical protein
MAEFKKKLKTKNLMSVICTVYRKHTSVFFHGTQEGSKLLTVDRRIHAIQREIINRAVLQIRHLKTSPICRAGTGHGGVTSRTMQFPADHVKVSQSHSLFTIHFT